MCVCSKRKHTHTHPTDWQINLPKQWRPATLRWWWWSNLLLLMLFTVCLRSSHRETHCLSVCLCLSVAAAVQMIAFPLFLSPSFHFYRHHLVSIDVECSAAAAGEDNTLQARGMCRQRRCSIQFSSSSSSSCQAELVCLASNAREKRSAVAGWSITMMKKAELTGLCAVLSWWFCSTFWSLLFYALSLSLSDTAGGLFFFSCLVLSCLMASLFWLIFA